MMVSRKHKAVFVAIPKTGTRTMYSLFRKHLGGELLQDHKILIPNWCRDFYRFTVIRSPYSRAVSCYRSYIYFPRERRKLGIQQYEDINTFLDVIKNTKKSPVHSRSQHMYLTQRLDKRIRQERYEEGVRELPFMPDDVEVPRVNSGYSKDQKTDDWRTFLNDQAVQQINEIWAEDFEVLDYPVVAEVSEL